MAKCFIVRGSLAMCERHERIGYENGDFSMMRRMMLTVGTVAIAAMSSSAFAGDCAGCAKIAKAGDGFCTGCGKGQAFGVQLTSQKLHAALAGEKVDAATVKCPGCKAALATEGKCEHCKSFAAEGKMFHSPVAHALAKGKPYTAEQAGHCPSCAKGFKENGFCSSCDTGFVAGRIFEGKESHDAAAAAYKTLNSAAEACKKCEGCATAMVTDGKCEPCKTEFKDGKSTKG